MSDTGLSDTDLRSRDGLPEALRVLLAAYPRGTWEEHGNFGEMVKFWLDRHAMFRDLVRRLSGDAEAFLDGRAAFDGYAPRLSQLGGFFLNQLHTHHQVEDLHYFPSLVGLEPRISHGFDMLEADHLAIDALLAEFAGAANSVLQAPPTGIHSAVGALHARTGDFARLLERHLTDEEDLIVPVILKTGFGG